MDKATLFSIREIVDAERKAAIEATHTAKGEPDTALAHARWERADLAYELADRLWGDELVIVTLTRGDAQAIADRIRALHHQPEWSTIDLNDAAEPLAWLLQPLAGALGEYGPGVRRDKAPVANWHTGDDMLDLDHIDHIKATLAGARHPEWFIGPDHQCGDGILAVFDADPDGFSLEAEADAAIVCGGISPDDEGRARFIAAAPTHVALLLAQVDELRAQVEANRRRYEDARRDLRGELNRRCGIVGTPGDAGF